MEPKRADFAAFACVAAMALFAPLTAAGAESRNEVVQVPTLPIGAAIPSIRIDQMVNGLGSRQSYVTHRFGALCLFPQRSEVGDPELGAVASGLVVVTSDEMKLSGIRSSAAERSRMEAPEGGAEYIVRPTLRGMDVNICYPWRSYGNYETVKGRMEFEFSWDVYSVKEGRSVGQVLTSGAYEQGDTTEKVLFRGALSVNVRKLLASSEFRSVLMWKPTASASLENVAPTAPISLANRGDGPASISDAVGDVVVIFTGEGMGSGFLVDESGLLITNRHVVGTSKFVKVRWSDGIETLGEVQRSDAKRDVALVKTDARGRKPLRVSMDTLSPGDEVYAIGTPLDEHLSNTVTRGVVSAYRVFNGLRYIQSDVVVNHGNSGGPLLDRSGRVIGLTVSGVEVVEGVPSGINLFIPLRDAFDFLTIKPQPGVTANLSKG